jgi:predicted nucleic acid-binding protein
MQTPPLGARVVAAEDQDEVAYLREQLDPGEAEAIVVAGERVADLLFVYDHADSSPIHRTCAP